MQDDIGFTFDGQLGQQRFFNDLNHLAQGGVGTDFFGADFKFALLDPGSASNKMSVLFGNRCRLPGQRGFIHGAAAGQDASIRRYNFIFNHPKAVTR